MEDVGLPIVVTKLIFASRRQNCFVRLKPIFFRTQRIFSKNLDLRPSATKVWVAIKHCASDVRPNLICNLRVFYDIAIFEIPNAWRCGVCVL